MFDVLTYDELVILDDKMWGAFFATRSVWGDERLACQQNPLVQEISDLGADVSDAVHDFRVNQLLAGK
jgi:hypothetical protein